MCSKETIDEGLEAIAITKKAILFLQNKKEIEKLVTRVLEKLLNKDDFYIIELKSNIKLFKHSIIGNKGHIAYIKKRLIHPKKTSFQEYNEDANELKKLKKAYCTFYTEISKEIKDIDKDLIQHQNIKDVLIESFKAFAKMYCPS